MNIMRPQVPSCQDAVLKSSDESFTVRWFPLMCLGFPLLYMPPKDSCATDRVFQASMRSVVLLWKTILSPQKRKAKKFRKCPQSFPLPGLCGEPALGCSLWPRQLQGLGLPTADRSHTKRPWMDYSRNGLQGRALALVGGG